ncbi:nicotinamide mononucleotide adenylyltransferase [Nonlabens ulvanivorans]|nr:nicotinamide mononucleotide adenylyltransferase [Nonlabens ulvanivorans]
MIADGEEGWREMLPPGIADLIDEQNLFGCNTVDLLGTS